MIHETLRSVSEQDYRDFRVLISIDGGDTETAAACQPFLADPRFSLVMQDRRLGWAGNINWLMARPDYDFFVYWQHDDLTSPDYISGLLRSSATYLAAVCHFTGIQWFGQITDWMPSSSVVGLAAARAISIFETLNGIPLRGLIRKDAIDRVGPIRINERESAFEEYVWIGKLAREGNLQYVTGPIYFKCARGDSTHAKWHAKDRLWRREVWQEFGLGMLEAIWPVVPEDERLMALCIVLDRLCVTKNGRFMFYDGPVVPFAADFLAKAIERFPVPQVRRAMAGSELAILAGGLAGDLLDQAIRHLRSRGRAHAGETGAFRFRAGDAGIDLLLGGWSVAESWGTWSDGSTAAALRVPAGSKRGRRKAVFTFRTFGRPGTVPVEVLVASSSAKTTWTVPANEMVQRELCLEDQSADDVVLRFSLPEATSPKKLGLGEDRRNLGMGLVSLDLTESN
jgi:glycosyltransferase involved in cell wall biosynthesis